jgi:hypothetical protein
LASIVKWDHLPQHDEELPEWPNWAYWCQNEGKFWATRDCSVSSSFGVYIHPSLDAGFFHVELLILSPPDGWASNGDLESRERSTLTKALETAADFRDRLWAYASVRML